MYAGRMGYGAHLPTSLGESPVYNLAGVSESGYGPYLGNIFDDISKIAGQVGIVSKELSSVSAGKAKIATVPTDTATLTIPMAGTPVAASIPLWAIGLGAAGLLYLAFGRRRR